VTNSGFHSKPFDEATLGKLGMFRDYLRAWLPVFIQPATVNRIQVFDFFAGPGCDADGNPGSPLIVCEEVRNALPSQHVDTAVPIRLYFNELNLESHAALLGNLFEQKRSMPSHVTLETEHLPFADAFEKERTYLERKNVANLLFLDQFGTNQITQPIFHTIVSLSQTDFLFFIASATVNRFKEDKNVRKCVPVTDEDCHEMNMTNVHRILAKAYRRWLPVGRKYYIAPFSLRKGANVYGLVFGSGHPLGINKFLDTAWKHAGEKGAGEANFDIDGDRITPGQPFLFAEMDKPTKTKAFEAELERRVLEGVLGNNREVYEYALECGMLPKHAKSKIQNMIKMGQLPEQKITVSYDAWKAQPVPISLKGDQR
jgi:three-Cys-motif partner protein